MIEATIVVLTPFFAALLVMMAMYEVFTSRKPSAPKGYWKFFLLTLVLGISGTLFLLKDRAPPEDYVWFGIAILGIGLAGVGHCVYIFLMRMPEKCRKTTKIFIVSILGSCTFFGLYTIGYAFTHIQCVERDGQQIPRPALYRVFREPVNLPLCP